jgi:hypothetical protein
MTNHQLPPRKEPLPLPAECQETSLHISGQTTLGICSHLLGPTSPKGINKFSRIASDRDCMSMMCMIHIIPRHYTHSQAERQLAPGANMTTKAVLEIRKITWLYRTTK